MRFSIFTAFKSNIFAVKKLHISLLAPTIWHTVQNDSVQFCLTKIITCCCSREGRGVFIKINNTITVAYYFQFVRLPCSMAHIALLFRQYVHRKKYVPKPEMTQFKCAMVVLSILFLDSA